MKATFYQVGGSVRDEILGLSSKDIDYAVEIEADAGWDPFLSMEVAILDRGGEIFLSTPKFYTVRAKIPGLGPCDFVLCRKDGAYTDSRRPDAVFIGNIFDDLARRDFTVNAIAKAEDGALIDPHDGVVDCKKKLLRCVGNTVTRFTEDGLRMLRALRFAITKDFALDNSISECLYDEEFFEPRLKGVSQERIREELGKCFKHNTLETLEWLEIFPELRDFLFKDKGIWLKPTTETR